MLSALGLFSKSPHIREQWKSFGRRLRRRGICPVVLTPAPPELWDSDLVRVFDLKFWDRKTRLSGRQYGPFGADTKNARALLEQKAVQLISLMAPCLGVSPGLLRRICSALPNREFHAGVQGLAWNHGQFVSAGSMNCLVRADAIPQIQESFDCLDKTVKHEVFNLVRAAHASECSSLRGAENYQWEKLTGQVSGETLDFFSDLVKSLDDPGITHQESLKSYLNGLIYRMLKWEIRDEQVFAAWIKLHKKALGTRQVKLPEHLDLPTFAWLLSQESPRELALGQKAAPLF